MKQGIRTVRLRACLRMLLLAAALMLSGSVTAGSLAEADALEALDAYADEVASLQATLLRLCESAPAAERFALYRTYNHTVGTALQIGLLRQLLASTPTVRRDQDLAQQARYTLWEIDEHIASLEDAAGRSDERARMESALLDALLAMRDSVRLLAERD